MKSSFSLLVKLATVVAFLIPVLLRAQINRPAVNRAVVSKPPNQIQSQTPAANTSSEAVTNFYDSDMDGIDDNLENRLLEKFRPYFYFSYEGRQDDYRPADIWRYIQLSDLHTDGDESGNYTYIQQSELFRNPRLILERDGKFGPADITRNKQKTNYRINPNENVNGQNESNPGRHGNTWSEVLAQKNIGLYGHVVPVKLNDPFRFSMDNVLTGTDPGQTYYKIEYWQFFGYNEANQGYIGNHEGDWTSVQVLYDPSNDAIISTFHFAHGVKMQFNFLPGIQSTFIDNGDIQEFTGANCCKPIGFGAGNITEADLGIQWAQNHRVRLYKDPISGKFTHPIVYIEYNAHEFWPTEYWDFYGAPAHNGRGYHFLTNTPPNLGEVENPNTSLPAAEIILKYNGFWGTFQRANDAPNGPALHKNWTWPASSSIRWQLKGLGY